MIPYPGESQRCAACGKMFTWLVDSRTRRIAAVSDDLVFGGDVERDGDEYTRVVGHAAIERYALHASTCGK